MTGRLEQHLKHHFGYDHFRTGQKEIIEAVLSEQNVVAVLPTGSGKSICYQLPALLLKGTVIVVSPLLSLMTDQVKELKAHGFKQVAAINSMITESEKQYIFNRLSEYKLLYVSPEMLQNNFLLKRLYSLTIPLMVIDEAHCISQWGFEFRPDYLRLGEVHHKLNKPTILALTATATKEVQEDIIQSLQMNNCIRLIYPMDKPNIAFKVKQFTERERKKEYIISKLREFPVPTMIYFSSRKEAEKIAIHLQSELADLRIAFYHGGLETNDRLLIQQQFMQNQLDVICCTSAFGMGINKQDVRLVIHYHIPSQIESFIQEVGRAGRDGEESISILLYHDMDKFIPKRLTQSELPDVTTVRMVLEEIKQNPQLDLQEIKDFILSLTQNNETHWRFLHYQVEKLGVLDVDGKVNHSFNIDQSMYKIEKTIQNRLDQKNLKLQEMVDWINTKKCRRATLFQHFQKGYNNPKGICCDKCDFDWTKWKPAKRKVNLQLNSWKDKLAYAFMQENIES
ncbi:RecQ family ATP-dependent DNA helicase [Gracilibacillus dipsosauri]|uniref:ATP-dependent DNA helicase RecQ n=1 Tax=Gracilibacillus dipsosauri TaxID=178340 RepID=A0A317KYP3_9BACI|nr:ATP-dependent DNA helicase RecQ [Gracilibacillus dipsosauri]PWU68617.1 ATP-dependent DNA helicase [Gracilibacillus dipsosauri]